MHGFSHKLLIMIKCYILISKDDISQAKCISIALMYINSIFIHESNKGLKILHAYFINIFLHVFSIQKLPRILLGI